MGDTERGDRSSLCVTDSSESLYNGAGFLKLDTFGMCGVLPDVSTTSCGLYRRSRCAEDGGD